MPTTTTDRSPIRIAALAGALLAACAIPAATAAQLFAATTLVSDQPGAPLQDASLVNAWGVSYSSGSPFWVSDNGTGVSTLYNVNPASDAVSKLGLTVTIPGAGSVTGQAYNGNSSFFNGNQFLFVSEDGTISGWRGALGTTAEIMVSPSDAVYKGSAIATYNGSNYLFAANFHSGAIDVLKGGTLVPDLPGNFLDPVLPAGYAPFNVEHIGNRLYVAYAQVAQSGPDEVAGPGLGIVDAFNLDGTFAARIATGGDLNAPWGMALAPAGWGDIAGQLLVGNFGDGRINVYDLATNTHTGQLMDGANAPLAIDGLWALTPGNGVNAGSVDRIYFTAGPNGEANGAFGVISPVPLPAGLPLFAAGVAGLVPWCRRKPRTSRGQLT